jgi:acylpyruvate hydrolase
MRLAMFEKNGRTGIAASADGAELRGALDGDAEYPGDLDLLIGQGADLRETGRKLLGGAPVPLQDATLLPPLRRSSKILCVGLNYADHTAESGLQAPSHPTIFARFTSSLIGHGAPIVRPRVSTMLDYEGEFVAVIGRGGRDILKDQALGHVADYALFNDGSIRDYQLRTPQWTVGKNFDGTGAFGPCLVTADEMPPGCAGLRLRTRLNGEVMQDASTGDLIVTGTPAGVGGARKPPVWMKPGDVCEVEVDGLGTLRNPIADQQA